MAGFAVMNIFKSRFNQISVWLLVLVATINLSGCHRSETSEEERARHHPRKDLPWQQEKPPAKKKLVGLFVDAQSKASSPDGKSWGTAFANIADAINVSTGQRIYVAAGSYHRPNLVVRDRHAIHLVGGYKAGELYEKENFDTKDDAWTILDGDAQPQSLMTVSGQSSGISFLGGFVFQNVAGAPAINIVGTAAQPIKNVTIVACRFERNDSAGFSGGGIHVEHAEDILFDNVNARTNRTNANGGFIFATNVKRGSISRGVWNDNRAANDGGALFVQASEDLVISGQVVKRNRATRGAGVFLERHHNQSVKDILFSGNRSGAGGGSFYIGDSDHLTVARARFANNISAGDGAAIRVDGSDNLKLLLGSSEVKGNQGNNGGAISVTNSINLAVVGGTFGGNRATLSGGTMMVSNVNGISLRDCAIDGSRAGGSGGGIALLQPGGQVDVTSLNMTNASADLMGGGFYIRGAHVVAPAITFVHARFEKNHAIGNGGALAAQNISYQVTVTNTLFKENTSDNYGGALALDGKTNGASRYVIGEGTQFHDNGSAKNFGGGAILAVFDDLNAALPLPAVNHRQLVFFNTSGDLRRNHAGDGQAGQFLRLTNHDVDHIGVLAPEQNGGADVFLAPLGGEKVIRYFIPYSMTPGHTALWDRLKLDWERVSSSEQVYAW